MHNRSLKFLSAAVLTLSMALAGCGSSSDAASTTAAPASTGAATAATATGDAASTGEPLNIVIITTSGVDDGSFNQNCYEGILAFAKDHPDAKYTDVKVDSLTDCVPTVEKLVGDYDVFVLPGYNFAGIGTIAQNNPDKKFIVVDSTVTDADGNAITLDNVYTMTYKEQEGGFFAGVAAAMTTSSNKVAVVNGMAFPSNVNYEYGFMSGVNYANKVYGTSAECVELPSYAGTDINGNNVGGNYVGAFDDEATGKVVGEALIKEGVDVIYAAAGASGNGTLTAIKEADGVWFIGVDVDQYDDGANGSSNVTLTSSLKLMADNVEKALDEIADGTFKGRDDLLGVAEGGIGYVSAEGRQQLSQEALDALADVETKIKDGTIVPASGDNGYTPDNFPGLE